MKSFRFPKLTLVPDDKIQVNWRGREYFVNGFYSVNKETNTHRIIIANRFNIPKIIHVLIHELFHHFTYVNFSNADVRENIDNKIDKYFRWYSDL